jgi:threonyl-tRNA synthetase
VRILQTHSDWIEYEPIKKEIPQAEDAERKIYKLNDVLVVFTAVEEGDDEEVAKRAIDEIKEFMEKLKINRILIYPFVHLSNKPAKPDEALKILKAMEAYSKELGLETYRAPFGWNKRITNAVKGHPLAEQSKTFVAGEIEVEEERLEEEEGEMERLLIILPDGKCVERSELRKEDEEIELAIKAELKEVSEKSAEKPPHVDLMRKLEIADYENVSDIGNLRFYPNGALMVELLGRLGLRMATEDLGAMIVKTPYLINPNHKSVSIMMEKFPERLYKVFPAKIEKGKEFRLRPACDYGVWSIFKDAIISHKNLPVGLYEFDIIWRCEQSGEVVGLYRLRNASMPDLHEMTADLKQAFERFKSHIEKFALALYRYIEIKPSVIVLNCKKDFFDEHIDFFKSLSKDLKIPIIVKLFKVMKTYKVAWIDVLAFDNLKRPMELTTVQLDTVSADWWNIKYIDKNGKEKRPVILHTGFGIERTIAALLENAYSERKMDRLPTLPIWLSPEQIRLIPVSDRHLKKCEEIAERLEREKIRVGIDDRILTVSKKVFEAKRSWIPYIIVIGDKELKSKKLPVVIRDKSSTRKDFRKDLELEEIIKELKGKIEGKPFLPMNVPRELSRRVTFVPWGAKSI